MEQEILVLGMEEGLEVKSKGDEFQLKIAPQKGYGERDSGDGTESTPYCALVIGK